MSRDNVTIIIHRLKTSYAKAFGEKFPIDDRESEEVLIKTAREVKKGRKAAWYFDLDGQKRIKFT